MRDAFGGAFSIKLMIIFLMLYVSFICVALNYARAFRVKNRIINIVEQNEGYNGKNKTDLDMQINAYLGNAGYSIDYSQTIAANGKSVSSCSSLEGLGYCIKGEPSDKNPEYYRVETYMVFSLPIININFPIAIRGETRKIELP